MIEKKKASIPFDKIIIVTTAISFIATILVYPRLPAMIPYHWGFGGSVETIEKWVTFITALMPGIVFYIVKPFLKKNQDKVSPFVISVLVLIIHWSVIIIAI